MKVLVVGGGGREHAIAWKLRQNPRITKLYCAPGNGGISDIAECVPIRATDIEALVDFAEREGVGFTVIGMEDPLALGVVDAFNSRGLRVFGPVKAGARIESSKAFSKDLMKKYNIPTAAYQVFSDYESALAYAASLELPIVVKADGLAAGKGVVICESRETARRALEDAFIAKAFGASGETVVIEEFMTGPEVSVLAFCDGKTVVPMPSAQDHKRALDNDMGLNTGGMGAISPSRPYTDAMAKRCMDEIFLPTMAALRGEGIEYKGIIFFGLMLTENGPKVIEYNARFGDPETQVVLPRLKSDLLDIFEACVDGKLAETAVEWSGNAVCCVMMASGGYPGQYQTGYEIAGDLAARDDGILVFHSGTRKNDGCYQSAGGRVLGVTAAAPDLDGAIRGAYAAVEGISFRDMHYRRDIGIK